jgi:LmbE family N-acetylglucosaminyl deacetylase
MRTLFIAPHNDDESLFGAYIIQIYKPLVVVLTDSYIQYERGEKQSHKDIRTAESAAAMKILSVDVVFSHVPDKDFNAELCEAALVPYATKLSTPQPPGLGYDMVFAPSAVEGGNWMHDVTGQVADKLFPGIVTHYSTYTKTREYPAGHTLIFPSDEMKQKKLQAIACYKSQMENVCRMYLTTPHKDEYFCS